MNGGHRGYVFKDKTTKSEQLCNRYCSNKHTLNRLERLASLPLGSIGPHLVQVNDGFQVIAREARAFLSHLVSSCGKETLRRG